VPPLLALQNIHLSLGSTPLLDGVDLGIAQGERICLVGRNGSGKSTLLKVAAGMLTATIGTRFLQPGTTLRYLPQEPDFTGFATTLDYVESGLGPGDDQYRAQSLLDALGLTGHEDPARLSGGEARRAALACVLAPAPDLLLLDEPTNHLDLPAIAWLEAELASMRSGMVIISHDRRMLETVTKSIVWLDRGTTKRIDRGFAHFEAWRDEVLANEEMEQHKLARQIVREEHWLRYGVTARRKRNMRRVGELAALRQAKRTHQGPAGGVRLAASEAEGSGKLVVVAEGVTKSFGGRKVVADFSTRVLRGDRVGIVGANGAGKTTLLRLLTGELAPDSGRITVGTNLAVATLDQTRSALDPMRTLSDTLTGGSGSDQVEVNGVKRHVIGYMKDFLFRPEQARTPVGVLSGGERARVLLAVALARPSNLMILDEPTNDLDLETLDLLQEMLTEYAGTVLLVSHDRDFLDRIVTSTIAAEGDGRWVEYAGGYGDMLLQRGDVAGKPAAKGKGGQGALPKTGGGARAKMSFKDKHALESLPAEMARLQKEMVRHQTVLADGGLYTRDPARFDTATRLLAEAEVALAAAEERWLALEMLRESLDA
jgi:ATP-binding cassette subfamily F protein uup